MLLIKNLTTLLKQPSYCDFSFLVFFISFELLLCKNIRSLKNRQYFRRSRNVPMHSSGKFKITLFVIMFTLIFF